MDHIHVNLTEYPNVPPCADNRSFGMVVPAYQGGTRVVDWVPGEHIGRNVEPRTVVVQAVYPTPKAESPGRPAWCDQERLAKVRIEMA